jgi:hypothetical protein
MGSLRAGLLTACLLAAACGSSSSPVAPTSTDGSAVITGTVFSFAEDFTHFTHPGATAQVTVLGIFGNSTTRDVTPTCTNWQSDNLAVVVVSSTGLLTALSSTGAATVATFCQGVAARGMVTVNPPPQLPPYVPPSGTSCLAPPYQVTTDSDGRKHCRDSGGQFALDSCCGI